jgi:t-SNARE complex subunit (syntaxin)
MNGKAIAILCIALFGAGFAIGFFFDTRGAEEGAQQLVESQNRVRELQGKLQDRQAETKRLRSLITKTWKNYSELEHEYKELKEDHRQLQNTYRKERKTRRELESTITAGHGNVGKVEELVTECIRILQQDAKE